MLPNAWHQMCQNGNFLILWVLGYHWRFPQGKRTFASLCQEDSNWWQWVSSVPMPPRLSATSPLLDMILPFLHPHSALFPHTPPTGSRYSKGTSWLAHMYKSYPPVYPMVYLQCLALALELSAGAGGLEDGILSPIHTSLCSWSSVTAQFQVVVIMKMISLHFQHLLLWTNAVCGCKAWEWCKSKEPKSLPWARKRDQYPSVHNCHLDLFHPSCSSLNPSLNCLWTISMATLTGPTQLGNAQGIFVPRAMQHLTVHVFLLYKSTRSTIISPKLDWASLLTLVDGCLYHTTAFFTQENILLSAAHLFLLHHASGAQEDFRVNWNSEVFWLRLYSLPC